MYLKNLKIRMLKKIIIEPQNKGGWSCLTDYYVYINIISNTSFHFDKRLYIYLYIYI